MPNHLSILGIIHTAISVLAILTALIALFRYGKLDPKNGTGKLYIWLTAITCLTALPIMKTGHPTAGHPLAIIILVLLPIGIYATSIRFFGKIGGYVQIVIMSFTLFLSMIPATVETLTRLPISHPLAASDQNPLVKTGLMVWLVIFIGGVIYQVLKLKAKRKLVALPDNSINLS